MTCTYSFTPSAEPCFMPSISERLGRSDISYPIAATPQKGLMIRTQGTNAFKEDLNGSVLGVIMHGANTLSQANDLDYSNPRDPNASLQTMGNTAYTRYDVTLTVNSIVVFSTHIICRNYYFLPLPGPENLTVISSEPESTSPTEVLRQRLNAAELDIGIPTTDLMHPTLNALPDYMRTSTFTIAGTEGMPDDLPSETYVRTGPKGAFVCITSSQNTDIESAGEIINAITTKKFNTNVCSWEDYNPATDW